MPAHAAVHEISRRPSARTSSATPNGPPQKQRHESSDSREKPRTIDFLVAINQRLWKDIKYTIRLEPGVQTPEETLEKMSGSCRDSAWLLCQLLRHCGLAARFVSGYLIQLKADVKSLDGPSGAERILPTCMPGAKCICPARGWIGLDPTSVCLQAKATFRSPARPIPRAPRQSAA